MYIYIYVFISIIVISSLFLFNIVAVIIFVIIILVIILVIVIHPIYCMPIGVDIASPQEFLQRLGPGGGGHAVGQPYPDCGGLIDRLQWYLAGTTVGWMGWHGQN